MRIRCVFRLAESMRISGPSAVTHSRACARSLRRREIMFVEFDQGCDMLYEVVPPREAHRPPPLRDRRLQVRCRVSLPDLARRVLMESMDEIVEFEGIDFATIPTIESSAKFTQGVTQVAIVSDSCPFPNQAFDPFRNFVHLSIRQSVISTCGFSRGGS